jgi:hypothetical protein
MSKYPLILQKYQFEVMYTQDYSMAGWWSVYPVRHLLSSSHLQNNNFASRD